MLILAIETSTSQGSVALARVEKNSKVILYYKQWIRQRSHGELVTSVIEDALQVSSYSLEQVDAFAVGVGPGSFTGIRVGLNVVKTLGYSLNKPIYTFSSLELLANAVPIVGKMPPLLAMINAHKSQCYVATFKSSARGWTMALKPKSFTLEKLQKLIKSKHICVGEGFFAFESEFSKSFRTKLLRISSLVDYPSALTMVERVTFAGSRLKPKTWTEIEALYIRGSEAEEKLKAGVLKPLPEF